MAVGDNGETRVRAWVLLKVENPEGVAQNLHRPPDKDMDIPWFIVRADVVDGEYNVVVPVDAADPTQLNKACKHIQEIARPKLFVKLQVEVHNPSTPHLAQGYVTKPEFTDAPDDVVEGLQRQSPGANAWG